MLLWMKRILVGIPMFLVTFIPVWVYVGARILLQPEGFWQELALGAVGIFALAGLQVMFLIGAFFAGIWLYTEWDWLDE